MHASHKRVVLMFVNFPASFGYTDYRSKTYPLGVEICRIEAKPFTPF